MVQIAVASDKTDFNAELHARPSIYFKAPAFIEHVALMLDGPNCGHFDYPASTRQSQSDNVETRIEYHTEFVTVTRVTKLPTDVEHWPSPTLDKDEISRSLGLPSTRVICQTSILTLDGFVDELGETLARFSFADTAASVVGAGAAQVCSDFRVQPDGWSRVLFRNNELNAYRLGRMVRRIYEIETYRAMALTGFPEARRLAPKLASFDAKLGDLAGRNQSLPASQHKDLLDEISQLSASIIAAAAETRSRFGATSAYAKIVEERIGELRETHVPGFQRFGVFVLRRFKPAVRTCEAAALRLDRLSHAAMHLLDLLQTRIQVEIELQNAMQIRAVADKAEVQIKIQRAVEGFSVIAISYYFVSLLKVAGEALDHAGFTVDPTLMLASIPVILAAVAIGIFRLKHALTSH